MQIAHRSTRKARFVFQLLALVFVVTIGVIAADASLCGNLHLAVAQARPTPTTVTNNATVRSNSISLGSMLDVSGQAKSNGKPLPNASVVLHMGDVEVAAAQTDKNGRYAFLVPVGAYYFPAALSNGATVYTIVEPHNSSFVDTPSTATSVPVDLAPLYAIIALVTAVVVVLLYLYARRLRKKIAAAAGTRPSASDESSVEASESTDEQLLPAFESGLASEEATPSVGTVTEDATILVTESERALSVEDAGDVAAVKLARELWARGDDRQAIAALYDAALSSLASQAGLTLAPHLTHWEHYAAIESVIPEMREPLRTLTIAFERTHYGGKSLTPEQRATAIAAFESINAFVEGAVPNT